MKPTGATAQELLEAGALELGIDLDPWQRGRLLELADHLALWAPRLNLTSHRTSAGILRRLVLDALAMERLLPEAPEIVDLGSGAGFPGLPLAISRRASRITLVESRERRHHFQRSAIRALALPNVVAVRGRIEEIEARTSTGVVAQALARPRQALELALPWCGPGGWVALPGGETPPDPGSAPGLAGSEVLTYAVPCGGPRRTLWLGRRAS